MQQLTRLLRYVAPYWWQLLSSVLLMATVGLLDAFRVLRRRLPNATLVLVHGDAPLSRPVRTLLHELGGSPGFRVVGHVKHAEMSKYVMAATAGVSIPRSDGSPSSVWEALAGGLPMVASDLPQIREKVQRSGAVRLVPPRRDAVAAALRDLLENPALQGRMARAARAWAVANIRDREQIARLGRVYAAIAKRRPPCRELESLPHCR